MSTNTALDPRILLAELAIDKLEEAFRIRLPIRYTIRLQKIRELIKQMNSGIQALKYSYVPIDKLLGHPKLQEIISLAEKVFYAVKEGHHSEKAGYTVQEATIYWSTRLLMTLPRRLNEDIKGRKIEAGVDSKVVGLKIVSKIDETTLFLTKVSDGENNYNVVTNIQDLSPGMKIGVSFLPPKVIGGEISEAMFLGDNEYPDKRYGELIYEANFDQVRGILKEEFGVLLKKKK